MVVGIPIPHVADHYLLTVVRTDANREEIAMTATTSAPASGDGSIEPVHASYFSLAVGALGFLLAGLGEVLHSTNASQLVFVMEVLGPLLIAIGAITYIDHLANRLGLWPVILGIIGSMAWALAELPYAMKPANVNVVSWVQFEWNVKGAAFLLISLSLFLVVARKEAQLELGTSDPLTTIHASFKSLTFAAVGFFMTGICYLEVAHSDGRWSRLDKSLVAIGLALIAVGVTTHIDHITNRLGRTAVVLGIIGIFMRALAYLPLVANLSFATIEQWYRVGRYVSGAGLILVAVGLVLVSLRKRTLESA